MGKVFLEDKALKDCCSVFHDDQILKEASNTSCCFEVFPLHEDEETLLSGTSRWSKELLQAFCDHDDVTVTETERKVSQHQKQLPVRRQDGGGGGASHLGSTSGSSS